MENVKKNCSLDETGLSYDQKFVWSDNPRQNVWNKVKKSSKIKIGLDWKTLVSIIYVPLYSYFQSLVS